MKKILMALTMIGMIHYSAEAQTKKNSYNQNYRVCRADDAYTICGEKPTTTNITPAGTEATIPATTDENANTVWVSTGLPQSMQMNQVSSYEGYYQHRNIRVYYDDPRNPYEGLPSIQDDGPAKNDERNLNYNQTSIYLPPVNGESR